MPCHRDNDQNRRAWLSGPSRVCAVWLLLAAAGCAPAPPPPAWEAARSARDDGRLEDARRLLTDALEQDPTPPDAAVIYNDRGVIARELGDPVAATLDFEASRRLDDQLAAPVYNLAVENFHAGRIDQAAALWQEAAALAAPHDTRSLEFLALLEEQRGNLEAAREHLQDALARQPESPRVLSALGRCELRRQEPAAAVERWLEALEANPTYAPAYYNLAVVHERRLQDPDGAAHYWRQFLRYEPESTPASIYAHSRLSAPPPHAPPTDSADTRLPEPSPSHTAAEPTRPIAEPAQREAPSVATTLPRDPSRSRTTSPTPVGPREPNTVDGFLERGRRLAREDREAQGYRDFRQAREMAKSQGASDAEVERILRATVDSCRSQPGAHYDYGLFLAERARNEEALNSFRQAVGLAPQWIPGYLGLAETSVRTGRYETAEAALNRILRLEPGHREALWGIAVLQDQGFARHQEALDAYRTFLSSNPDDHRAGQARQRIQAMETLLRRDSTPPRNQPPPAQSGTPPTARTPNTVAGAPTQNRDRNAAIDAFNRGAAFQARQDWDQAILHFSRAVEYDDTFTGAFYSLGAAYHNQDNPNLARAAYRRCIQLDDCHVNSRFNLALLNREQGDPQAAVDQLNKILECDPRHARTYYLLGLIYADAPSRHNTAADCFRQFLQLSPNDAAAPSVRQWLNSRS